MWPSGWIRYPNHSAITDCGRGASRTSLGGLGQFWLRPLSIRIKSVQVRLKLFSFVVIIINVNMFSYSRTFVWPGSGACLQNMEAELLDWAWGATTLGYLVGTNGGWGQGRFRDGSELGPPPNGDALSPYALLKTLKNLKNP